MYICISYIGAEGMDGGHKISIPSLNTRVQPLQWFEVLVAYYLVDFIIIHGHHLEEDTVCLINVSCYP